jgi:hypothetical protein
MSEMRITFEEKRRSIRSVDRLASGTHACPECDAPVAIGPGAVAVTAPIVCPYCARSGPLREFLSLAAPTRPARVVVRIALTRR